MPTPKGSQSKTVSNEGSLWQSVGAEWRQLYGSFASLGVSFEWQEFSPETPFNWGRSFHPQSLEICLNLRGGGVLRASAREFNVNSSTAIFYWTGTGPSGLEANRSVGERHEFLTIEFSRTFLEKRFGRFGEGLHPVVRAAIQGAVGGCVSEVCRLTTQHKALAEVLRKPPVVGGANELWYEAKAMEVAALFFFQTPTEQDLFCRRQQVTSRERVEKVRTLLQETLAEPPSLDEIARKVGCSPFYLSRTFSKETEMTIPQFIRKIRMERAAELLRSGKYNVTEAAMEVGYSSLSHFSLAFHEVHGCCPGLYPLFPKIGQRPIKE
jgi:AraC-like DNA-binding protein